jgi:transcriptional regulator
LYQPPHFIESDRDTLHALIRAHPLGLLISATDEGPVADPIPFLLDPEIGANGRLRAHVARANPQWKLIGERPERPVLVVFQGTDAYVTPSWYETKRETGKVVPTWNYAIVQVAGKARVMDDKTWIARQSYGIAGVRIRRSLGGRRCARCVHRGADQGDCRDRDRNQGN